MPINRKERSDSENERKWKRWENRNRNELDMIQKLTEKGHHPHCANRQIFGDGECECDMYEKGYDPYGWMKHKEGV